MVIQDERALAQFHMTRINNFLSKLFSILFYWNFTRHIFTMVEPNAESYEALTTAERFSISFRVPCATLPALISGSQRTMIHCLRGSLGWVASGGLRGACLAGPWSTTSSHWAWSAVDSGWLGECGIFGRARNLFLFESTVLGATSGKGVRDTMGLRKRVVASVVIVGVMGSFGLGSGEFVGLKTSRLFLGLFTETGGFGEIWGSPKCNRLSGTFNRDKSFHALFSVLNVRTTPVLTGLRGR